MPATETTSLISLTCLTSSSSPKQSKTGSRHPKTGKSKSGNSNSNSNCSSSAENMSARDRLTAGLNTAAVDDENNWEDDDSGSASGSASGGGAPRMSRHHQQDGRLDNRQQERQVMHGLVDSTNISFGLISTLFIVFSHLFP